MALDRLPGWNAERPTNRWAFRSAYVFAAVLVALALLAALTYGTPLEEYVDPADRGFPVGDEPEDVTGGNGNVTDPQQNDTFEDPDAFEDEPGAGSGRHTEPRNPADL